MIFLLYSQVTKKTVKDSLGLPEYSYYFVLKEFLPAFERLGEVVVAEDLQSFRRLDQELFDSEKSAQCIVFAPPNKCPANLKLPSVLVFAWEFDRIPDETWAGDASNDWRSVFKSYGRAICLSDHTKQAVHNAMGDDFPVLACPVPLFDRVIGQRRRWLFNRSISCSGSIIDTRQYQISQDQIALSSASDCFAISEAGLKPLLMDMTVRSSYSSYLVGFYEPEAWGAWSKIARPWILLPCSVKGRIIVEIEAAGYGYNAGKEIAVTLGNQSQSIILEGNFKSYLLPFVLEDGEDVSSLHFDQLDLRAVPNATDPRSMAIGLKFVAVKPALSDPLSEAILEQLHRERYQELHQGESENFTSLDFQQQRVGLMGFDKPQAWGVSSKDEIFGIILSKSLSGRVIVRLTLKGFDENSAIFLDVRLADCEKRIQLGSDFRDYELEYELKDGVSCRAILFKRVVENDIDESEPSSIRISFRQISVESIRYIDTQQYDAKHKQIELKGCVYTSVLNPADDRKNWQDILTAFVYAFKGEADATLVLKMTHHSLSSFVGQFHYLLQRMAPFDCRVVVLHGYLDDAAFSQLIACTRYYVNASRCEGLCMPLMEFMSKGVPALAPDNTAMSDYITNESAFIVASSKEPSIWPHDDRQVFRTFKYRIDWMSLVDAYQKSFYVSNRRKLKYRRFGKKARRRMESYCSVGIVSSKLSAFFDATTLSQENLEANRLDMQTMLERSK